MHICLNLSQKMVLELADIGYKHHFTEWSISINLWPVVLNLGFIKVSMEGFLGIHRTAYGLTQLKNILASSGLYCFIFNDGPTTVLRLEIVTMVKKRVRTIAFNWPPFCFSIFKMMSKNVNERERNVNIFWTIVAVYKPVWWWSIGSYWDTIHCVSPVGCVEYPEVLVQILCARISIHHTSQHHR